jgi:hypothetical protein
MMGSTILLVGFIGLIQAIPLGAESLDTARNLQLAHEIASTEVEKLRGGGWDRVANLPATATISINSGGVITGDATVFALSNYTVPTADDNADLTSLARGFTCAVARTYLRPTAATASTATFVKVVYTITWTSSTGRLHRHQAETYLGKNGLHLSHQQS